MPNRLDEMSRVIGNIEAEARNLSASVADARRSLRNSAAKTAKNSKASSSASVRSKVT
jgi:hypothetical protein